MAPVAIHETKTRAPSIADLKAKLVNGHVEIQATPPPPQSMGDSYMYDFKFNHKLPTSDVLGVEIPDDVDAAQVAEDLLGKLAGVLGEGDAEGFADLFLDYGVWRDRLSYTWDYRTFNFRENVLRAASDLFATTHARKLQFLEPAPAIQRPYPGLAYLQFVFRFETELVRGSAVAAAVLTLGGWKLYYLNTAAEGLLQYPEVPPQDGHVQGAISWEKQRALEDNSVEPEVLIVGGGQNGLAIAARLKVLGTKVLIIDRSDKIGSVWRDRYEYLTLHFPHWADHLPYFPYPEHWPSYTPAQKQGLYMEWYASALELPVWTRSEVVGAEQSADGQWTVHINKEGCEVRTLHPKHVVMATSLCGVPMTPVVPGMADFKGVVRHSTAHDSSRDFIGKKVCVVGTSSSGFDTAFDCARRGIDVTLLQRSPTYIMSLTHSVPRNIGNYEPKDGKRPNLEEQDRLMFATPTGPGEELARRNAEVLENLDRELLDGLHARGLRTWRGQRNTGQATLGSTRNGGFYFDAGACEHIINGNIKVEPGFIEAFTQDKVILSGGREREFDLVVFATGFSGTIDSIRATLGDSIADRVGPIWGIDEEGELKTAYKETGVSNLWLMAGYLPMTRYHSRLLALRIKASLEGVSPAPYKA